MSVFDAKNDIKRIYGDSCLNAEVLARSVPYGNPSACAEWIIDVLENLTTIAEPSAKACRQTTAFGRVLAIAARRSIDELYMTASGSCSSAERRFVLSSLGLSVGSMRKYGCAAIGIISAGQPTLLMKDNGVKTALGLRDTIVVHHGMRTKIYQGAIYDLGMNFRRPFDDGLALGFLPNGIAFPSGVCLTEKPLLLRPSSFLLDENDFEEVVFAGVDDDSKFKYLSITHDVRTMDLIQQNVTDALELNKDAVRDFGIDVN